MRITMDNFEHPTQENYEHEHLSVDQWVDVIERAKQAEGKDLYLYILRSWANQQVVSNASICAFRGQIVEDVKDRQSGSNAIAAASTTGSVNFELIDGTAPVGRTIFAQ